MPTYLGGTMTQQRDSARSLSTVVAVVTRITLPVDWSVRTTAGSGEEHVSVHDSCCSIQS